MNETYLEDLITIAHGIARQFGHDCEVCIHDLEATDMEHTIVFIINGYVTGRKVGDGASKAVLEALEARKRGEALVDHLAYRTHTADGRILKSSTIFLKDGNGEYRYLMGINYDITSLVNMEAAIGNITEIDEARDNGADNEIPMNVNDLLNTLIDQSVKLVGKAPALMTKDEKIRAIHFLRDAGAFLITKSGDKVSSFYGISKFTLYSYIDQKKNS